MPKLTKIAGSAACGIFFALCAFQAQAVSCWQNLPATNPNEIYVDNGDGTITDERTGLMWRQCIQGRSGAQCEVGSIFIQRFTWGEALESSMVSEFAGYKDWRVPNVKEVATLVEECRPGPTINNTLFPNTPATSYWTGSPSRTGGAWYIDFNDGYVGTFSRSEKNAIRLVRGGK